MKENIFKTIVEFSTDWIMWIDKKKNIKYISPSVKDITGYSADEFLKNQNFFFDIIHNEDTNFVLKKLESILKFPESYSMEFRIIHKNGDVRWISYKCKPVFESKNGIFIGLVIYNSDITHLKEPFAGVKKSEESFKTVVEQAPNPMVIYRNSKIIYANKAAVKAIGGESANQLIGRDFIEFIHPDSKKTVKQQIKDFYNGKRLEPIEEKVITLDGREIEILVNIVPIILDNEPAILSQMIDITEIKKAERAIKNSEKKYKEMYHLFRLMADNMPDLLWAKDVNGKFLFVNKADAEFLGAKDTEEPIGKDDMYFARRYREERPDRDDWFTFGELCVNSDEIVLKSKKPGRFDEFGNVRGEFLYLDVCKAPIFDEKGNIIGTVGHGRIVTKEKEIEKKLKESEEKYRKIFEESQDVIFVSSIEGKIIDINPAGLKFFGYESLSEIKAKNIYTDIYKNNKDREKFIKEVERKGYVKDFEVVFKKKDGEEVIGLLSATPIYDDNNIKGFRGTIRDITEKRQLERQLLQAQKMEAIGRLAGGIAHDFNNILTVINGYSELLLKKISSDNPFYKEISAILNAGNRAQKLVNQLLGFSRKQVYKPEVINLNELIISIDKMLNRIIDEDIQIEKVIKENIPLIKADTSQVEQIFLNLIVNAKDALNAVKKRKFKKKITIETGYKFIDKDFIKQHPSAKEGEYVFFAISDNGIGMDEETQNKIFEPFYTTKEKDKGTGLGLSMVYGIVKQNNGYIYVYSKPDEGTTFKIYWPVAKQENITQKEVNELIAQYGSGNILIVEDNEDVREFAVEALKALGFSVNEAENGKNALELIKDGKIKPDLILTDIIMPELNGIDLIDEVKKIIPDIKVIYTSGYAENSMLYNGKLNKGVNFLEKPFTLQKLSELVNKVMSS